MESFDQFLATQGRADLVLGRVAPLTSRIAVVLKTTLDEEVHMTRIKDLHELHQRYKESTR
jgi:hypothetical protein